MVLHKRGKHVLISIWWSHEVLKTTNNLYRKFELCCAYIDIQACCKGKKSHDIHCLSWLLARAIDKRKTFQDRVGQAFPLTILNSKLLSNSKSLFVKSLKFLDIILYSSHFHGTHRTDASDFTFGFQPVDEVYLLVIDNMTVAQCYA